MATKEESKLAFKEMDTSRALKKGVLILSGGMDSVTLLYDKKDSIGTCVSFAYGSNHSLYELTYAKYHAEVLGKEHILIDLKEAFKNLDSALLSGKDAVPEGHYEDESMKKTVVPFRNGVMLSLAIAIAESRKMEFVYIGAHAGDHAIYPDCRKRFMEQFSAASLLGTYSEVQVVAPYIEYDKRRIGKIGQSIGVEYSKTYTCYKGEVVHCGKCGACTERREALAGFDDTVYFGDIEASRGIITQPHEKDGKMQEIPRTDMIHREKAGYFGS